MKVTSCTSSKSHPVPSLHYRPCLVREMTLKRVSAKNAAKSTFLRKTFFQNIYTTSLDMRTIEFCPQIWQLKKKLFLKKRFWQRFWQEKLEIVSVLS